jgi:hypothetical protein
MGLAPARWSSAARGQGRPAAAWVAGHGDRRSRQGSSAPHMAGMCTRRCKYTCKSTVGTRHKRMATSGWEWVDHHTNAARSHAHRIECIEYAGRVHSTTAFMDCQLGCWKPIVYDKCGSAPTLCLPTRLPGGGQFRAAAAGSRSPLIHIADTTASSYAHGSRHAVLAAGIPAWASRSGAMPCQLSWCMHTATTEAVSCLCRGICRCRGRRWRACGCRAAPVVTDGLWAVHNRTPTGVLLERWADADGR